MAPYLFNKLIMNGIGLSLNLFVLCFRNSNFLCFLRVMLEQYSEVAENQRENFPEVEHLTANSLQICNLWSSSDSSSSSARESVYDVYSQPRICLQTRFWILSTWPDREISADLSGKDRQRKNGKWGKKKEN